MSSGVILLLLAMALDVFAGGLALGIAGLPRSRWVSTAVVFAIFGVTLLAAGVLLERLLDDSLGTIAKYLAGGLLIAIGVHAIGDVWRGGYVDEGPKRSLEPRAVVMTGLIVSVDKLAVGIAMAVVDVRLGPVLVYLAVQGFAATWIGLTLGTRLGERLGDAAHLTAGIVFALLG